MADSGETTWASITRSFTYAADNYSYGSMDDIGLTTISKSLFVFMLFVKMLSVYMFLSDRSKER